MRKWFGRGFVSVNLSLIKIFYLLWSAERIFQTTSKLLEGGEGLPDAVLRIGRTDW